jgi:hypothetical protein
MIRMHPEPKKSPDVDGIPFSALARPERRKKWEKVSGTPALRCPSRDGDGGRYVWVT